MGGNGGQIIQKKARKQKFGLTSQSQSGRGVEGGAKRGLGGGRQFQKAKRRKKVARRGRDPKMGVVDVPKKTKKGGRARKEVSYFERGKKVICRKTDAADCKRLAGQQGCSPRNEGSANSIAKPANKQLLEGEKEKKISYPLRQRGETRSNSEKRGRTWGGKFGGEGPPKRPQTGGEQELPTRTEKKKGLMQDYVKKETTGPEGLREKEREGG